MDEYRRRLERTQNKICVLLLVLLFGGIAILPWIGQVIWLVVIAAVYIRTTLVIARTEELLEKLNPTCESNERSAWYDARQRRIVISNSDGTWVLGVDPNCDRERTEITRQIPCSYPGLEPNPHLASVTDGSAAHA